MQFRNYLPWLIIPFCHNPTPPFEDELHPISQDYWRPHNTKRAFQEDDIIGFFNLTDNKTYKAEIPELLNRRICGSCPGGWLITVHENSQVQLFNPFTSNKGKVIHHLPPLTKLPLMHGTIEKKENEDAPSYLCYIGTRWDAAFHRLDAGENCCYDAKFVRDGYLHKIAMSSSTVASGTIIMVIQGLGRSLAFYRIGSHKHIWTSVSLYVKHCMLDDLTFFRGEFYAVHGNGYVLRVHGLPQVDDDEQGEQERPVQYVEQIIDSPPVRHPHQYYIVESSDDLLVVLRYLTHANGSVSPGSYWCSPYKTVAFKVFKLDFRTPNNNWVPIESFGDRALFLGYNSSFSVLSNNFHGCKPNCIYFTDSHWLRFRKRNFGGHDMGIFHLEDDSIDTFLYPSGTHNVMPPPMWFTP